MFNIIELRSWLIIDDLAESMEEWSQEMLQLFTIQSHHEKIFITVVLPYKPLTYNKPRSLSQVKYHQKLPLPLE